MAYSILFAHPNLLVFVSAEDPDFGGIFLEQLVDDLMAERVGAAGDQYAFARE
jgi:hypothetical protein